VLKTVGEEVEVFEETEITQVQTHAQEHEPFAKHGIGRRIEPFGNEEIDHRREHQQEQESPVPPTVEHIAGEQQHDVLSPPVERIIQRQDQGEE
jgi:hypothetical protein